MRAVGWLILWPKAGDETQTAVIWQMDIEGHGTGADDKNALLRGRIGRIALTLG